MLNTFEKELADSGVAKWTRPKGGYFISLEVLDGCAKRVVQLAKEAGVELTPAGTETQFRQTLLYATRAERDADMEGVVTSSLEAFERLDSYLSTLPGTR